MIELSLLKELGVTQDALKSAFTAEKKTELVKSFVERASDRIQEGIDSCTSSYQLHWAIDRALDSQHFAKSRTLFAGLMSQKLDTKDVLNMVKGLGLNDWSRNVCGCGNSCTNIKTCQSPQQRIDIPAFFEVTFPIALAMKTIRAARLYNDRNLFPQFKYEPMVSAPEHRLQCEIITQRVQVQAQQMEYKATLKQVINQMLSYSQCMVFPKEAWWFDQQPTSGFTEPKKKGGKKKRKMKTVREGIRYETPHPSRCYKDLSHPAFTLNSNTGCQYAGFWELVRYGDVKDNPHYWNKTKITFGKDSFRISETNRTFFATMMPCSMKFPTVAEEGLAGTNDRQEKMQLYTNNEKDNAVLFTNHFERLNPMRDLGLKNKDGEGYDGDVWFRFVFCSDDTVVYAEPLTYTPTLICQYDPDQNKAQVTSLVQECIPTEDMVGNLLSQAILTAKNNLTNINFFDEDQLDQTVVEGVKNLGEKAYRAPVFIGFSKHKSDRLDQDKTAAIIPVPIQRMSISECLNLINVCLDILARGLVMSPHEIGQSDSHEVTAQEVLTRAGSTSTRLAYTASGVDDFIYAWQRQLHDAGMAYWDDEIFAEVALQSGNDKKVLEDLGFKIETENSREQKVGVRGSKQNLELEMFTARRDAPDRANNIAMATAMTNFFQAFINNPMAIQIIGIDQFVDLVNGILDSFQFKKDWRMTAKTDVFAEAKKDKEKEMADAKEMAQAQSMQAVTEQLKQLIPQIQQDTVSMVGEQLLPVFQKAAELDAKQQQQIEKQEENTGKLVQILQGAGLIPPVAPPPAQPMMAPQPGMMA